MKSAMGGEQAKAAAGASVTGIHHVTAFAKDPVANRDFYTRVLGLRLVKKTVNFDDPGTYHLYYGDAVGTPGTLITHFPHPMTARGRHGSSEISDTVLRVAPGSMAYWTRRLEAMGVRTTRERVLGRETLGFVDGDGMRLGMVEDDAGVVPRHVGWIGGGGGDAEVEAAHAIRGVGRVVIRVPRGEETAEFLVEAMGFVEVGREGAARRLVLAGGGGVGASAAGEDLVLIEDAGVHEPMGAGTVHHVAWRVPDSAAQARAAERLARAGVRATAVMDREYFRSIYFRVPGGVVFEIATDGPGFAVDEEASRLGDRLCLPRRYEGMRAELERSLVAL